MLKKIIDFIVGFFLPIILGGIPAIVFLLIVSRTPSIESAYPILFPLGFLILKTSGVVGFFWDWIILISIILGFINLGKNFPRSLGSLVIGSLLTIFAISALFH